MAFIEWRDDFLLGIQDVDHEHRELIALINRIHEQLEREDADLTVQDFLADLYTNISAHFALEERHMRDAAYAEFDDHKADHERLLDEIRTLMDAYEDGLYSDINAFAKDLDEWFLVHFRTRDARYHRTGH